MNSLTHGAYPHSSSLASSESRDFLPGMARGAQQPCGQCQSLPLLPALRRLSGSAALLTPSSSGDWCKPFLLGSAGHASGCCRAAGEDVHRKCWSLDYRGWSLWTGQTSMDPRPPLAHVATPRGETHPNEETSPSPTRALNHSAQPPSGLPSSLHWGTEASPSLSGGFPAAPPGFSPAGAESQQPCGAIALPSDSLHRAAWQSLPSKTHAV